jgi:hypothetical protein
MAYKQFSFTEENQCRYKGIKYYTFSDRYIICLPNNIQVTRFTKKDVKTYITEFLNNSEYKYGWTE